MKFRNKISRHIVTNWESHYIPYQQLKTLLKAASRNYQKPSVDFYTSFSQAITGSTAFSLRYHSALQNEEERLERQLEDHDKPLRRLGIVYLSLLNLRESSAELLWFCRINHEAMTRIYTRLVRIDQACSSDVQENRYVISGHCAEHKKAYSKCLDQLDRIQARLAAFQSDSSVGRIDPHSLDQDYQALVEALHESNTTSELRSGQGRTLLHFGAAYGMINLCRHILSTVSPVEKYILLPDGTSFTPLHLAVSRGHVEVTQLLLLAMDPSTASIPDELLHIALRREDDAMVKLLVSRSVGLKHKSISGESCIYIAAQLGRADYLRQLLLALGSEDIDAAESTRRWTPLFIGCVEGHLSIVRHLLKAGASTTRLDYLGWTAQENAAFRGHLLVAGILPSVHATPRLSSSLSENDPQRTQVSNFNISPGLVHLIVNLGGLQERDLSKSSTLDLLDTLGHGLVLSISTSESPKSIERLVPLLNEPADDTFVFTIKHPAEAAIVFNLHRLGPEQGEIGAIVGSGVAFLFAQSACLGARHGTLLREQSIPILSKDTLRLLGTITFSFLIAEPYYHSESPRPSLFCLDGLSPVQLVGHRGFGQNSRERFLQLGENTIQLETKEQLLSSLVTYPLPAMHGVGCLRGSDVQLTKDLVPVLFHDYSLSESGTDIAIHDVTVDQFMHASRIQSPQGDPASVVGKSHSQMTHGDVQTCRLRSRSFTTAYEEGAKGVKDRMKYTVDYMNKGFKPNTRGDFVHDIFATLEEVLCNVPETIGFDMEIKYPRLHEALDAGAAPVSIDINIFVDTILDTIARFSGARNIILSSFTPEICILLAIKQKSYPVLFITNAGKRPIADKEKRAGSLQVAVRFAKQWGLSGIVVAADSLVMCPRLIGLIKSHGLVCGSYNDLNNEPANVELQVKAGLNLVVADRVGLISRTLKKLAP